MRSSDPLDAIGGLLLRREREGEGPKGHGRDGREERVD